MNFICIAAHRKKTAHRRRARIPSAERRVMAPDARGRFFFSGCARSDSTSAMSLSIYTALAVRQNATNALSDVSACEGFKRPFPNMSGAKTMTFLIQCFGRRRATAAGTIMCRVMWQ